VEGGGRPHSLARVPLVAPLRARFRPGLRPVEHRLIFWDGMGGDKKSRFVRMRRRIQIRYGVGKPEFTGYSGNISRSGLMIRALRVFEPGTVLDLEVLVGETPYRVRGKVRWAREGNVTLLQTGRIGMGVQFVEPTDAFLAAVGSLDPGAASVDGAS